MTKALTTNVDLLLQEFEGNEDQLLFFVTWLKNGFNAGKAYKELHPDVTEHSARTLGSRELSKVDKKMLLAAYGLDSGMYIEQLKEGLNAMKVNEFTGEMYADHFARKPYHDKLGKLLGFEKDKAMVEINQQTNVFGSLNELHEYILKRKEEKKNG